MKYVPADVAKALDELGVEDMPVDKATPSAGFPTIIIGAVLSDRVRAIIETKPKARGFYEGRGKTDAIASDGRTLDTTSSGYDYSLALSLIKHGVDDPSEIATAICLRPDGAARAKGIRYVARTVQRALDRAGAQAETQPSQGAGPDFRIDRVRVFASNPPTYEFTVEGITFTVTSAELNAKSKFAVRFMDALRRLPLLPRKADAWRTLVNGWLKDPEVVEMPPEASDEPALREAVERAIENLPQGKEPLDLDNYKCLSLEDGRRAFKAEAVLRALEERWPDLQRNVLCRVLRDLGYLSETARIEGKGVRVWVRS